MLGSALASYAGNVTLTTGHTDVGVVYDNGQFFMNVHVDTTDTDYDPKRVVLSVGAGALTTVPTNETFSFLGNAGDPVWVLPQVQDESLLFLGFGSDGLPEGVFTDDVVHIQLIDVKGPGEFAMFGFDPFGTPFVVMNTRDDIDSADSYPFVAGSDAHFNWAFSEAGKYRITFETTATLLDGTVISTGQATYSFEVVRPRSRAPRHFRTLRPSESHERFHMR